MNLDQFDYVLPPELIAQQPLADRETARLMVVDRSAQLISHHQISDLPGLLGSTDTLVLNNTQVIAARLVGIRVQTGGKWQGLFIKSDNQGCWRVLSKTGGILQVGEQIQLVDRFNVQQERLTFVAKETEGVWVVKPDSDMPWTQILSETGHIPIPPYIRGGKMEPDDIDNYQTVFASKPGAVAAPTAGLHFTHDLLDRIVSLGIQVCEVTLHVGVGTFRPVTAQKLDVHVMHSEWGELNRPVADMLKQTQLSGGRIVCVGTTTARVLETAADNGRLKPWRGETDLFIRPGFEFKAVDLLLTNFHLPKSTLLIMVRQFGGDALIRRAYREAIQRKYRFYSYGDAMLII